MSTLAWATIGGMISFISTAAGAVLAGASVWERLGRWRLGMDFTLGLMVSAAAFSLIWPAFQQSVGHTSVLVGVTLGVGLIGGLKLWTLQLEGPRVLTSQGILALTLMLHNFPEGLASGAAMAGLEHGTAYPILAGIAFQNFPEGALMVVCLRGMGWTPRRALLGGLASGGIELIAAIMAGFILDTTQGSLPFLLALAGGAMLMAVGLEMHERGYFRRGRVGQPFMAGLIVFPALQLMA